MVHNTRTTSLSRWSWPGLLLFKKKKKTKTSWNRTTLEDYWPLWMALTLHMLVLDNISSLDWPLAASTRRLLTTVNGSHTSHASTRQCSCLLLLAPATGHFKIPLQSQLLPLYALLHLLTLHKLVTPFGENLLLLSRKKHKKN